MTPHFIAGAAIYTLAQFLGAPLEALFAVACAAIGKECWVAAQARIYTFNPIDALAVLGGGLLIYLPTLIK
jgi:hypothetical protein